MGRRKSRGLTIRGQSIRMEFTYRGVRCKETLKLAPTSSNMIYAERRRSEILSRIERDTFDYAEYFPNSPKARTLGTLEGRCISIKEKLTVYLKRKRGVLALSTWKDYQSAIDHHLSPHFGSLALSDLTVSRLRDFVSDSTISRKRINNVLQPLREIMNDAMVDGQIARNPFNGFRVQKVDPPKETDDIDPFTPSEIGAIIDTAYRRDDQLGNLFTFWVWTGLRTSELIALMWGDLDEHNDTVRVRRARVRGQIKTTKTRSGTRDVKLLTPARDAVERQKDHTYLADIEIFYNPRTGQPWAGDGPIRKTAWRYVLKAAGVRYRYPYQLRHTYASTLLSAGVNPLWVAGQMGHSDTKMIFTHYGRWIEQAAALVGEDVESKLGALTDQPRTKGITRL